MKILKRVKCFYILLIFSVILTFSSPLEAATPISTFGRGSFNTDGEMNFPSGIAVDNSGNVYVCSGLDDKISKFDSEGNFLTSWMLTACMGLDTDNDSNVYVSGDYLNKVIKYDSNGVLLNEWGSLGSGDGQFNTISDITINRSLGRVYVMDMGNCRMQVFDTDGNFLFKWGDCSRFGYYSKGIAVNPATDEIYVTDAYRAKVQIFDRDGSFILEWGSPGKNEGQIRWPRGIDVDSYGNVFLGEGDNERISIYDSSGNFIMHIKGEPGVFVPSCYSHLSHTDCTALHNIIDGPIHPRAVVVDRQNGNIFVAASYSSRVDKYDSSGNFLTTWGWWEKDNGVFNKPSGMAIDNLNGYIYIADTYNFLIQKFDLNGNYSTSWGHSARVSTVWDGGDGSFDFPTSITTDNNGNVYVVRTGAMYGGDPEGKRIQKFDQNGNFLISWNSPGMQYTMNMHGIVYNPYNSYIYVSNTPNDKMEVFDVNGTFLFEFGYGVLYNPTKAAVNPGNGNIFIVDSDRIMKFSSDGIYLTEWGSYGSGNGQFKFDYMSGIYVDDNGYVYVADTHNYRIQIFDSNGNFVLTLGGSNRPSGIVVDSNGYIYSLERGGRQRVEKFSPIIVDYYLLAVNKSGSGNGSVASSPAGIDCGIDCTEIFNQGAVVTLTATADGASTFTGWTGGGCSGTGDCIVTMNAGMTITATFDPCPNLPVRISGLPPGDSSIQVIYDAAVNGDIIQSQSVVFLENFDIDIDKSVTFKGGYDCDYINNAGTTILNGNMTISNGTLTIDSGRFEIL